MKVIVAGSRGIVGPVDLVANAIEASGYYVTEIVSGGARGVDTLGEEYAIKRGILCTRFPVTSDDWKRDPHAGHARNERMAKYSHALVACWDGKSPGTRHMITIARRYRLLVYIHRVVPEEVT
jgi:hypothetical protein